MKCPRCGEEVPSNEWACFGRHETCGTELASVFLIVFHAHELGGGKPYPQDRRRKLKFLEDPDVRSLPSQE